MAFGSGFFTDDDRGRELSAVLALRHLQAAHSSAGVSVWTALDGDASWPGAESLESVAEVDRQILRAGFAFETDARR